MIAGQANIQMYFRHVLLLWVLVSSLLAGCATPRYQTAYRYEPPTDMAGQTALQKCTLKLETCQTQCTITTQSCLKEIEPVVDMRTAEALKQYEAELPHYRLARQYYDLAMSMNRGYNSIGYDARFDHLGTYYAPPPVPPKKPERHAIFEQVRHEKCEINCGCQALYDACFIAVGGKKIPEVQCIANCPQPK